MASMLKRASTAANPASPISRRRRGERARVTTASARAAGVSGGTRMPETPSATTSGMPPTAEATTGLRRAMASRMEMPCASRREGRTAMSRSAVMALMSSRRPVKMILSRAGSGRARAWARSSSHWEPSPTMASQVRGARSTISGMASMRKRCPFSASRRATTPSRTSVHGMPYSSRRPHGGAGSANRERSTPLGTMLNGATRPSWRTLSAMESEGMRRWSISGVSRARVATSSGERTREEWTVAVTTGVPAATAARVPTTSARYMWAWTRSISLRRR